MLVAAACVDPYHIEKTTNPKTLVVEAVFSDQLKNHQVLLSRATSLDNRTLKPEQGATVSISDQLGNRIDLTEVRPGVYETPQVAAEPGNTYTLRIETEDGGRYSSDAEPFKSGTDIGNLYVKYINNPDGEGKGLQVFLDAEDASRQTNFYRWNYIETYEVHAPFPSNWIWLGGNKVEFRHEGIDTCFVTDTLRSIMIRNTRGLEQDKITALPVRYLHEDLYVFRYKYSILVQQFALSEGAYNYWENLRIVSEEQGSLSDIQPGTLPGNMFSEENDDETVLGYFEACTVREKRLTFSAIDFYQEGLKMPENMRSDCFEIPPLQVHESLLGSTMERQQDKMYIWEVFGFTPDAIFSLMPKVCCDCRDLGPTERPDFLK